MRSNRFLWVFFFCILFPIMAWAGPEKKKVVMIISARDSLKVARAFKALKKDPNISKKYSFEFFTDREISKSRVKRDHVSCAHIILADFMKREFDTFLAKNLSGVKRKQNPKVYSLRCAYLAEKLKKIGFNPDPKTEKYYSPATVGNIKNLILLILSEDGEKVAYDPPFILPASGIFHPDSPEIFPTFDAYLAWYEKTGKLKKDRFWVGVHTFHSSALKENGKMEAYIIKTLERERINVLPAFGRPPYHKSLENYFLDEKERSRVQAMIAFSFRFLRGFPEKTEQILKKINSPIFMPLTAHAITINQWRKSDEGISPLRVAWQVCIPEQNGAIEPSMVGGKSAARLKGMTDVVYDTVPMPQYIDFLIRRIKGWQRLKAKPNGEKKVAILYWNHPPGKQNIGGSYMNCFRSISQILSGLKRNGYKMDGVLPTEEDIKESILLAGRNVGTWAPGELEKLISQAGVIRIPVSRYKAWFGELDPDFQQAVVRQWGRPEDSDIMTKSREIIIPAVPLGNIILLPQPSRGFGEDPEKLYHDPKIYPHHQYIAFYLWLKKEFQADAMIGLGKHGTHEWLPGKQIGLSLSDPPEVLIQDIPNIYPYIVDNVGEGTQAKRRGRGVIIDHLIPPLKKGGSYMEYRKLTALIDEYHDAKSKKAGLAEEKLKRVQKLILKLGLDQDLGLKELDDNVIETVEHYILELQENLIPYGLHTFGISPRGDALNDLTEAVCAASPEIKADHMKSRLKVSGRREMTSLLSALEGGFVPAGEGNDPIRNPAAVPTGRNFYAFNVDKVPSKEAWALGQRMADDMIHEYREKHGAYPEKMGIIVWSTELQRNEGASIGTVLSLVGITPVWDNKDHVVGLEPIPGTVLNRPRIDVLVQSSGLFRDSYAKLMKFMDRAVRMAGSLGDVENFVALNNKKIAQALLEKGYSSKEAQDLSQARIFGPMPGAYSHALQELIPNSGVWEDDQEIADVFIHHYAFAYGEKLWGKPLKSAYKNNLKEVNMTMHTRSSNLYSMLDNDDMFAFLGGLSLAVKSQKGEYPDTLVANIKDGKSVVLEDLPKAIGKALRTRYLNPKWIEGMKQEGFSGAKAMDEFVENLWGFQVTNPYAVDGTQWEQIHAVYVEDKYGMELKAFFDEHNPWAQQSMSARMLEADRKKYWKAPKEIKKKLAKTYALNVMEKGVACCEHTCNNPMFQQFVTNIISLNGLLTPRQLDQFKMVIAKATGRTREENQAKREKSRESLKKTIQEIRKEERVKAQNQGKKIEGFEMVDEKPEETQVTSSGSEWMVMVIAIGLLGLLFVGWKRMKV